MEEALTQILLTDTAVLALVGDQVHWRRQPAEQNAWPYINLNVFAEPSNYSLDGEADMHAVIIQADCWGESYGQAVSVQRAVNAALSGLRGPHGSVMLQGIFAEGLGDLDGTLGDMTVFGRSVDFRVVWSDDN